jgi:hypothetical protein
VFIRDELIKRAKPLKKALAAAGTTPTGPVATIASVRVASPVRVRAGAPSTSVPSLRVIPAGSVVIPREVVAAGELVNGNAKWYRIADGEYIWAGATDNP